MAVLAPTTLDDALTARAAGAVVLAGGTDLMVEVNEHRRRLDPDVDIVSLRRVAELTSWTLDSSHSLLTLGAATTWAECEREPIRSAVPALAEAARTVGSPQIRNAGTVGGNVVTCSPAGDGLPVLAALGADVVLASAGGVRSMPIAAFMTGVKQTALRPDEILTQIRVPLLDGWQGYSKVGVRNAMVIATASACVAVDEPTQSVRIALGAVGPTVIRCTDAELLASEQAIWDDNSMPAETVAAVAATAAAASRPIDDHRSTAAYRRRAVEVMVGRLLRRAFWNDETGMGT